MYVICKILFFQVVNGYFTHFFAPVGIEPLRKRILFILDVSGSMSFGRKITQLKEAMTHILKDLNEDDLFNIVTFESTSLAWSKTMKKATPENTKEATEMVQGLFAEGGMSFMRGNMVRAREIACFCHISSFESVQNHIKYTA